MLIMWCGHILARIKSCLGNAHSTVFEGVMDGFNLPCYLYARDNIQTCLYNEAVLQIQQSENILFLWSIMPVDY